MKAICDTSELREAAALAAQCAKGRTTNPVLTCLHLEAAGSTLAVTGTNVDQRLTVRCAIVQVEQAGAVLADAELFNNTLRHAGTETVALELAGDFLLIRADGEGGKLLRKLPTRPATEFPPAPTPEEDDGEKSTGAVAVEPASLSRLLRQTEYATNPAASGGEIYKAAVMLELDGKGRLRAVGTDGRRLAIAYAVPDDAPKDGKKFAAARAVIPLNGAALLGKVCAGADGKDGEPARLVIGERSLRLAVGGVEFTSNVLECRYPPVDDVIPKDPDRKLTAGREALTGVLARGGLAATEQDAAVRCDLSGDRGIVMTARSSGTGESEADLACKYEGEPLTIGFNPVYLREAVDAAETDEVTIEFLSPSRPCVIRGGEDMLAVVMPVNLK